MQTLDVLSSGGSALIVAEGYDMGSFLKHIVDYCGDTVISSIIGADSWTARIDSDKTHGVVDDISLIGRLMSVDDAALFGHIVLEPGELALAVDSVARNIGAHSIAA